MKQQFHPFNNLPSLSQLFQARTSKLPMLINNLKLKDVEEDEEFEKTKQRIKDAVLLTPIVFEEPQFIDHEYEERQTRLEQQIFSTFNKDIYIHEIRYNFTGSVELFGHTFDGMSYSTSDHGLIKPESSNYVTVYAELPTLSPDGAINLAGSLFRLSKYIAEHNSEATKVWNVSIKNHINAELELKRDELFRVFKKK
ncbi:hypothetical protein D3C87_158610 [compost metagenome]